MDDNDCKADDERHDDKVRTSHSGFDSHALHQLGLLATTTESQPSRRGLSLKLARGTAGHPKDTNPKINNNMDEYQFKPLEDWLKEAKKGNCQRFIAMAVNKDNKLCATVQTDLNGFMEMLITACHKNPSFATAIMSVATILSKEAEQGCHNCQHAGLLGGNEKDPVALAHCIIHKENHRLPFVCDEWKQREEKGEQQ